MTETRAAFQSAHPAIAINTLSLAPAPLTDHVETIARLGAAGVTPDLDQILAFGPDAAQRLFRDAGLAVAAITHRAFGFHDAAQTAAARDRLLATIDIAARCQSRAIVLTSGGRGALTWRQAANAFAEAMAPCAAAAEAAEIALALEPTSHLYADVSIAHRLSDAAALARTAGIGVAIDLFACWTDADIDAAIAATAPISAIVQVSDTAPGDRSLPCRAVPGDGMVPLATLIAQIVASRFDGWFDLEVIGPRLQAEGQEAGLRRAMAHLGALLDRSGAKERKPI